MLQVPFMNPSWEIAPRWMPHDICDGYVFANIIEKHINFLCEIFRIGPARCEIQVEKLGKDFTIFCIFMCVWREGGIYSKEETNFD